MGGAVGSSAIAPVHPVPGRCRAGDPSPNVVRDGLAWYLARIGRQPLLTAAEERELARCIERGARAQDALAKATGCTRAALRRQVRLADAARDRFVQSNLRLVVSIAARYATPQFPLPDCIQEGNLGLLEAVRRFDHRRGFRFSTYASWWIRQAITRALTDKARTIRLPAHVAHKVHRIRRASDALTSDLQRSPTPDELAAACGMAPDEVAAALDAGAGPVSIHADVGDDAALGDFIEDTDEADPAQAVDVLLRSRALGMALAELTAPELDVLTLRFGFDSGSARTLADVGTALHLRPSQVRLLEEQAVDKLRRSPLAPRFVP
jgi:RNA polymerase primary sigma factor